MKKIFIIFLMLFAFKVSALTPEVIYQENIYSNRLDSNNKIHSGLMAFMFMNDKIVYCLDPYKIVSNEYSVDNNYQINDSDLEYFKLVAYYGYDKFERNDIYYYMAAQELIWERILGGDKVWWTTERYNEGSRINIDSYKNEILNNINTFYISPSFDNTTIDIPMDIETIVEDTNGVTNDYIVYSSSIDVYQLDNAINISPYDTNDAIVYLRRDINFDYDTTVYTSDGQTLATFGGGVSKLAKLYVKKIYDKNVYLRFIDSETLDVVDTDFSVCELDGNWYKYDDNYYTYSDKIKDGVYNICGLDDYEIDEFEIVDIANKDNYIDIYLNKKEVKKRIIENIELEEDKNIIKPKEVENILKTEKKEIIQIKEELPNTYDYEFLIYLILFTIIGINLFYEIKIKN